MAARLFREVAGGFLDRRDDIAVAGAAAEIAGDRFFDLLVGRITIFLQQTVGGHQHAGRAVAALHRVVFPKRLLQATVLQVKLSEEKYQTNKFYV